MTTPFQLNLNLRLDLTAGEVAKVSADLDITAALSTLIIYTEYIYTEYLHYLRVEVRVPQGELSLVFLPRIRQPGGGASVELR